MRRRPLIGQRLKTIAKYRSYRNELKDASLEVKMGASHVGCANVAGIGADRGTWGCLRLV